MIRPMNESILKSLENGTSLTLVMHDPFEPGATYEVKGVVVALNHEMQRVKVRSDREVLWLPIEDIAAIDF